MTKDYRDFNEDAPTRETRKEQKIKHSLFDRRTGRIAKEHKSNHRVQKQMWVEDAES